MSSSGWDNECVLVADGEAALEALRRTPVDVVISDWMMPGIEGPELCCRLRAAAAAERIRAHIQQLALAHADGVLTVSGGVAMLEEDEDPQSLIGRADPALYEAKRAGRNRVLAIRRASAAALTVS